MQAFLFSLLGLRWALWLLLLPALCQAQMPPFELALGYATGAFAGVQALTVDAAGNTYFVGKFAGTQAFGTTLLTSLPQAGSPSAPSDDLVVAKLDPAGNFIWASRLGSDSYDFAGGVALDAQGNVYATGYFHGYSLSANSSGPLLFNSSADYEIFVVKLNGATGQPLWWRRAGGTGSDVGYGVAVNTVGDVFISGSFSGPTASFGTIMITNSVGNGKSDGYVAKLTSAGAWQWVIPVGGTGQVSISRISPDGNGMLYLGAYLQHGTGVFGATTLRANTAQNSSLASGDVIVAKLSEQGSWQWAVHGDALNGNNNLGAGGPAYDGMGHLYMAGTFRSQTARLGQFVLTSRSTPFYIGGGGTPYWAYPDDGFVARLNAQTGAWEWVVQAGGTGYDALGSPTVDTQGRVYVMGGRVGGTFSGFESPLPGGGRVHLAQLDGATGAWRWASSLGAYVEGGALGLGPGGKLTIGGGLRQTPGSFPPFTVAGSGSNQVNGFVARLGSGPLSARPLAAPGAFRLWPNPAMGGERAVWVAGATPGQAVVLTDALGREVLRQPMPTRGDLRLGFPAGLRAGLYSVRCHGQVQKLLVE